MKPWEGCEDPTTFEETGIWTHMPFDVYIQLPGVNGSSIKGMCKGETDAHYFADKAWPSKEDTVAQEFGTVGHCALLEPEHLSERFQQLPLRNPHTGKKFVRNGSYWEELQAQFPGATWVSAADLNKAQRMAKSVRSNPKVMEILEGAEVEVSIQWIDPGANLLCKARIDILNLHRGIVGDPKTTKYRRPYQFCRKMYDYGYHIQSAMCTDGLSILLDDFDPFENPIPFKFIPVEKEFPHLSYVVNGHEGFDEKSGDLDPIGFLNLGRQSYRAALQHLAFCIINDIWQGHGDEERSPVIPAYALQEI